MSCTRGMPKYWAASPKNRKPFTPWLKSWIPLYGYPFNSRSQWDEATKTYDKVKIYYYNPWIVDL